jgi:hypothetical protein
MHNAYTYPDGPDCVVNRQFIGKRHPPQRGEEVIRLRARLRRDRRANGDRGPVTGDE